jgi:Transport and Golgi organisation 2
MGGLARSIHTCAMCSLSWSRRRGALVVVMNRDERRDRAPARPPRRWRGEDGGFLAPVDGDAGGTWIAVKDSGVVLALLNHHSRGDSGAVAVAGARPRISRGLLVTTLTAEAGIPDAARLRAAGLAAYAPFRLFVTGPRVPPRAFTWNGATLSAHRLDPNLGFLTSSSWNARAVVPARHARFRAFARAHRRPTRDDLLGFHAQAGDPRGTPWAICMSRDDARTVSVTAVEVTMAGVSMRYRAVSSSTP